MAPAALSSWLHLFPLSIHHEHPAWPLPTLLSPGHVTDFLMGLIAALNSFLPLPTGSAETGHGSQGALPYTPGSVALRKASETCLQQLFPILVGYWEDGLPG